MLSSDFCILSIILTVGKVHFIWCDLWRKTRLFFQKLHLIMNNLSGFCSLCRSVCGLGGSVYSNHHWFPCFFPCPVAVFSKIPLIKVMNYDEFSLPQQGDVHKSYLTHWLSAHLFVLKCVQRKIWWNVLVSFCVFHRYSLYKLLLVFVPWSYDLTAFR